MPVSHTVSALDEVPVLSRGKEPQSTLSGGSVEVGRVVFKDALILVIGAWVVLLLVSFSLRSHSL